MPPTRPTFHRSPLRATPSARLLAKTMRPTTEGEPGPGTAGEDWRDDAACRGLDVTWFYPDPDDKLAVVRAQTFCASCPVRRDCARYAIVHNEKYGVWGGSTEQERAAFKRALSP